MPIVFSSRRRSREYTDSSLGRRTCKLVRHAGPKRSTRLREQVYFTTTTTNNNNNNDNSNNDNNNDDDNDDNSDNNNTYSYKDNYSYDLMY